MKTLLQRVTEARVEVEDEVVSSIGPGLLVLVGVQRGDDEVVVDRMAGKIRSLRVFEDEAGKMNDPVGEREILCVSQFTLCAETRKGTRPGFADAAEPRLAEDLYERLCEALEASMGVFGATMQVHLVNDGPVTISLEIEASDPR